MPILSRRAPEVPALKLPHPPPASRLPPRDDPGNSQPLLIGERAEECEELRNHRGSASSAPRALPLSPQQPEEQHVVPLPIALEELAVTTLAHESQAIVERDRRRVVLEDC